MPARSALPAALLTAAACALALWQYGHLGAQHVLFGDFHAFYCGGRAAIRGWNPYLAESLMRCEAGVSGFGLQHAPAGLAEPVPFPGYAFALFMPFALLPYAAACALWLALLAVSAVYGSAILARVAHCSFAAAFSTVVFGFLAAVFPYGELSPVIFALLAASAAAAKSARFGLCAAMLCGALALPHVVAPAFLALAIWEPRTRVPLAIGAAVLVLADLAVGGPALALSYFLTVLPAHAQSEIGYITQYGLTWPLHALGVPDRAAMLAGDLSYAISAAAGIGIAGLLARRFREPALLVLAPPAFAVAGGPFIHYSEIMLALPALLLLAVRSSGVQRTLFSIALVLTAIPWQWLTQTDLIVPALLAVFAIALLALRLAPRDALRYAAGAALLETLIIVCAALAGPQMSSAGAGHVNAALAQASWSAYVRTHSASSGLAWWVVKAPTWLGLLLLAFGGAYAVVQKDFVAPALVEHVPARP